MKDWAARQGFNDLDAHLESFKDKCAAKGYRNVDWDAAFMGAIREDWAKLRQGRGVERRSELDADEQFTAASFAEGRA